MISHEKIEFVVYMLVERNEMNFTSFLIVLIIV